MDNNQAPEANNTPDAISFAELQKLAANAPEEQSKVVGPYDGLTQTQLENLVESMLDDAEETCGHPMLAKLTITILVEKLMEWHTRAGEQLVNDGERAGIGWLRDAGKLQAIGNILSTIEVCNDDFLVS